MDYRFKMELCEGKMVVPIFCFEQIFALFVLFILLIYLGGKQHNIMNDLNGYETDKIKINEKQNLFTAKGNTLYALQASTGSSSESTLY